jgi:hypothetical protein
MELKAIETVYNGYRFRSRLEARWAVFFDALGVTYEYEKEGYDLDGTWYLPDFWLPTLQVFVEVKPQPDTQPLRDELCVAIETADKLAKLACSEVFLITGAPERYTVMVLGGGWVAGGGKFVTARSGKVTIGHLSYGTMVKSGNAEAALLAAQQARFEHGENGAPKPHGWRHVINTNVIRVDRLRDATCPSCHNPVRMTEHNIALEPTTYRQHACLAGV